MNRLRNLFIAGLLVLIPVVATVWILQLLLGFLDAVSQPFLVLYIGRPVPGVGVVLTALIVLALGYMSTWFAGRRVVEAFEGQMARIPIVGSIYSTTRQVVRGFSSSEGMSFKRTVLIRREGALLFGFVTGEFVLAREGTEVEMASVYVPTNHLYLGDVFIMPRSEILEVDMTLEEGISAVLSCGGSLPDEIRFRDVANLSATGRIKELARS